MAALVIGQSRPSLLIGLNVMSMPYRSYLQGAVWSGGFWWLANAQQNVPGAGGDESIHISKFDAKGKWLGWMTLLAAGHGSAFAMVGDDVVVGWDESGGRRIRRIQWTKDRKATRGDATVVNTGTGQQGWIPLPLSGNDFCLRRYTGGDDQFSLRTWSNPDAVRKRMIVDQLDTFQGAISFGDSVFVVYGTTAGKQLLAQFKWPSGSAEQRVKPFSTLDIRKVGLDPSFSSKEPEGFSVYNGVLTFGQRLGSTSRRVFRIFALSPVPVGPPVPPWPPVVIPPKPPVDVCA